MNTNGMTLATPEVMMGFEAEMEVLAGRGQRLQACLVDLFLGSTLLFALIIADAAAGDEAGSIGVIVLALLTSVFGFYQLMLLAKEGQTIGKRWMGIRILRLDGRPVDFLSAVLLRTVVGGILLGFIPFYGIIDALAIFGADRRCLHDRIATTKVIRVR